MWTEIERTFVMKETLSEFESEADRLIDKETGRQTRQHKGKTGTQIDRPTDRSTDRQAYPFRDRQTCKSTNRQTYV